MKQNYSWKQYIKVLFSSLLFASCFCKVSYSQSLVVGNLGTGSTSQNGTVAPAGQEWHELQTVGGVSNTTLALGHVSFGTADFALADDFTIPAGQTWNLTTIRVYALDQTGSATSNYNNIRIRIYDGVPGAGGTVVFGDMTTNRFAGTGTTNKRAIFSTSGVTTAPSPNLPIHFIDANVATTLTAGTYWIEWQVVSTANTFAPVSQTTGVLLTPGSNARQRNAAAWTTPTDQTTTNPVALPFVVNYNTGACTGTPTPGNTITTASAVCPSTPFTLSLQNATVGSGVTYQWQSGPSATGPFTNIAGATNSTLTVANLSASTFYQAIVTCSGNQGTSTAVQVSATPANQCYCIPPSTDCTDGDVITNVRVSTLNNSSTCSPNGYVYYNNVPAPDLIVGAANPITVTTPGQWSKGIGVWIDYNKNGIFEASEYTNGGFGPAAPASLTSNIVIPSTAQLGITRMRVRLRFGATQFPATSPCINPSGFGETEDYNVNLVPCDTVKITTNPSATTTSCGNNVIFGVKTTGSLPTFTWQYRTSATAAWQTVPNAAPYGGVNTDTLTITNTPVNFNNYQYRVLVAGACAAPSPSTAAILTVNKFVLNVTPLSGSLCAGGTTPILLTTPATTSVSTFQNTTSGVIPDDDVTGITRTFNVSGLTPPILSVRVVLNITHPYVSDVVASLKAPNGSVINLDYFLNTTGAAGANFVNTGIASNLTTPRLNGTAAPHTANHAADLELAGPFGPTGPTGFAATSASWNSLYSVPNGVWTLGMYDGGATDIGTFNNATLEITTGSAPATSTYTPLAGLFTNAAGTIPYTGGPVTQVYALPTTTTIYNVVTSTSFCTADTQRITISVNSPATSVAAVTNKAVCVGGNTTFTSSVTGGTGVVRNWQVSTDGGATYTNLTNTGAYTGTSTDTLRVTGITTAMNGYRYRLSTSTPPCAGTVFSTAGALTVNPTPVVVLSTAPYSAIFPGLVTTLTAAVSPNAAATYRWFRNGVLIPGVTGNSLPNIGVDDLGDYSVSVTDVNGCIGTSNTITIRDSANSNLFIYPSPNNGQFSVRIFNAAGTTQAATPRQVVIYDSRGARVYSQLFTMVGAYVDMKINLANHGKGIYSVDVLTNNGERIKTGRVAVF